MKNHAQGIIIPAFSLVVTDEALKQWRTKYHIQPKDIDEDELRTKILRGLKLALLTKLITNLKGYFPERIVSLIGTADRKDSFFIYGGGTVSHVFHVEHSRSTCSVDSPFTKHDQPEGPFEHRSIKEVIIRTVFISSRGMDCLADAFEQDDIHPFNPVPLETIALAATAV